MNTIKRHKLDDAVKCVLLPCWRFELELWAFALP